MNTDTLTDAVKEHMSALKSSTDWGIGIAAVTMLYVAIGTRAGDLAIGGIDISNKHGYIVAAAIYVSVILILGVQLLRVENLLRFGTRHLSWKQRQKSGIEIVAPIVAFPWILNPFCYYGYTKTHRFNCAFGCFLLVLAWWLGFIGLSRIDPGETQPFIIYLPKVLMFLLGFSVVFAVYCVLVAICDILTETTGGRAQTLDRYEDSLTSRLAGLAVGQFTGIAFYFWFCWPVDSKERVLIDIGVALILLLILLFISCDLERRKVKWRKKRGLPSSGKERWWCWQSHDDGA